MTKPTTNFNNSGNIFGLHIELMLDHRPSFFIMNLNHHYFQQHLQQSRYKMSNPQSSSSPVVAHINIKIL